MSWPLDAVKDRHDQGYLPVELVATEDHQLVYVDDHGETPLPECEWGPTASGPGIAATAVIVAFCGWCADATEAKNLLRLVGPDWVGPLFPRSDL